VSLEESFSKLVSLLKQHPLVVQTDVISEQMINAEGYIRLIAKFINGNELHVFEYRVVDDVQKYAYHLQNSGGKLIFRYDNRARHPEIETFPHHKHLAESPEPKPSQKPSVKSLLVEASRYVKV
jgi:hypothetical protein